MRRTRIGIAAAIAACFVIASAGEKGPPASATGGAPKKADAEAGEPIARARDAADALTGSLMAKLLSEMRSGGPAGAVHVCSEVAQQIAKDLSRDGLEARRVSLKARNPADAPDDFERRTLEWLESGMAAGQGLPRDLAVTLETGGRRELRYLRPIRVAEPCLPCHGEASKIDPEVKKVLAERYPGDRATGYSAGDLRGAVSVTVKLD